MDLRIPHHSEKSMKVLKKWFLALAAGLALITNASAQKVESLVVPLVSEPPVRLFVESPLAGPLAKGVAYIAYRLENLRVMPLGGAAATGVSPRVGHLHVTLDDLPWLWADYGQSNTIILVNLPAGEHTVRVEAVDPEGLVLATQVLKFTSPGK
jgi:hypothetical protein